jgi:hypothetical protein
MEHNDAQRITNELVKIAQYLAAINNTLSSINSTSAAGARSRRNSPPCVGIASVHERE